MSDGRLVWAVVVNVGLTLAQIVGGLIAGSLALVADALHNLSDAGSLVIALIARKVARRRADERNTFGYARAEVVATLINLTTLVLIGLYLIYEALLRFADPTPVGGWIVVIVGGVALIVDLATAALTYAGSKNSMNIRAAFLHNVADALGSVAVIFAGTAVLLYGWHWVDPLATLLIAGYVLYHGLSEMGPAVRILMGGTPPNVDVGELAGAITEVEGVVSTHHLHVWQLDERRLSLEAHVVVDAKDADSMEIIKTRTKRNLAERFGIHHSTLEIEFAGGESSCTHVGTLGCEAQARA